MSFTHHTRTGPPGCLSVRLQELLHQADQILLVERSRAVGAGIEETPHRLASFDGIEDELLFDQVLIEEGLVEGTDGAGEGGGR